MKKRFLASATAFALILSLLPVASLGAETPPAENSSVATTVEDAILYTSEESGSLDYNVVYTDEYNSEVKILDSSNSVEELETVMGVADAPKVQLGTSTGLRTLGYAVTANLGFDEDGDIAQIEITDVNERPIVGISWKKDNIGSDYQGFAEAFERNGAYAVYLPQVHNADEAREVLSQIDGIFMTGGEDWNPSLYGEEPEPHGAVGWNNARDTSDIKLMQQAIEGKDPVAFKQIRKIAAVCLMTMGLENPLDYVSASMFADRGIFSVLTDFAVGSGECNETDAVERLIDRGAAQLKTWLEVTVPRLIDAGLTAISTYVTAHCPAAAPVVAKVVPVVRSLCQMAAIPAIRKGAEKIQATAKSWWQKLKNKGNSAFVKIVNTATNFLAAD